jgi:hypothetical protein
LTSALDGGERSASRSSRFTPRERATGTHWIGGWVGPRAGLDAVVKRKIPSPCRDSMPPTIQPVAQRYTSDSGQKSEWIRKIRRKIWAKSRVSIFPVSFSRIFLF